MAKKPAPPQNPIPPQDNSILQEFNRQVQQADLPIRVGDGTDLGDIAKRALNKTAQGKDLSTITTETLDETTQSPSVQTAKVLTGGERAQAAMRKAEKAIKEKAVKDYCEELSRRDFLTWLFGGCVLGGVVTYVGDQLGFLNGAKNFIRDAMKGGPTGRFIDRRGSSDDPNLVKGRVYNKAGYALWTNFPDESYRIIMGGDSNLRPLVMQVFEKPPSLEYSGRIVFFSPTRIYQTPEGQRSGKQILKDFSGTDYDDIFASDPASQRFNYVEAVCDGPFSYSRADSFSSSYKNHDDGVSLRRILKQDLR